MERRETVDETNRGRRLDLNAAQIAGSAVATVVAAVLASELGVYGTIIGAGVVSVVATSAGPVFQHFFRRTGEQIRDVTVHTRPRARTDARAPDDADPVLPTFDRAGEEDRLTAVAFAPDGGAHNTHTYGTATVHGTVKRGRRTSALAAAVVFVLAMGSVTVYELAADESLAGGPGTTFGRAVQPGESRQHTPAPAETPPATPDRSEAPGTGPGDATPEPSPPGAGGTAPTAPAPDGSPSGTASPDATATATEPAPDSPSPSAPETDEQSGSPAPRPDPSQDGDGPQVP